MTNNSLCSNCLFWKPPQGEGQTMGQCRKLPPKAFMILVPQGSASRIAAPNTPQMQSAVPMFLSAWPPSPADGWCGDHIDLDAKPMA